MKKSIRTEEIPISEIVPFSGNPRKHSEKQINQIALSIKKFGFASPIILDEGRTILAGHGRFFAAQKNKIDRVPCVILSGLTEKQKRAYRIVDNKLTDNSSFDATILFDDLIFVSDEVQMDAFGFEPLHDDVDMSEKNRSSIIDPMVLVTCKSITEQDALIQKLLDEGYDCKAFN